jgi:hypothetical protein
VKEIKLSATRISAFLQCKYRYWLNYVEKAPKLDNPAFKLGLACHSALEYAGNLWKDKDLSSFSKEQIKDILLFYDKCAIDEGIQDYAGFKEGRFLVKSRRNEFAIGRKIVGLQISLGFPGAQDLYLKHN